MIELDHEELRYHIRRYYEMKKSLYIWGETGIGKSWSVRDVAKLIAKEKNRKYYEIVKDTESKDSKR